MCRLTLPADDGIVVREVEEGHGAMDTGGVPVALRERLGEEGTLGLLDLLEHKGREWREDVLSIAADRFGRVVAEETGKLRALVADETGKFRALVAEETGKLRVEIAGLRAEFREGLAVTRADMLKWSFLFWVGQVAVMAGLLAFMLRAGGR